MFKHIRAQVGYLGPFLLLAFVVNAAQAKTLVFQQQSQSADAPSMASSSTVVASSAGSVQASAAAQPSAGANSELFFMLEQLQQEVRELRGVLEEQGHQIRRLQQDGKSRYKDLDNRVLNLTKQVSAVGSAASEAVKVVPVKKAPATDSTSQKADVKKPAPAPTAEQRKAYQDAYAFIKEKKFEEAIDALHLFLEKYPEGELAGNAYYWLGEVYLVLPQLEQARQSFTIVVKSFPDHRKVADALFKLGVAYDRLQDPAQSEQYLNLVQSNFPESTAAKLAKAYKINR